MKELIGRTRRSFITIYNLFQSFTLFRVICLYILIKSESQSNVNTAEMPVTVSVQQSSTICIPYHLSWLLRQFDINRPQ